MSNIQVLIESQELVDAIHFGLEDFFFSGGGGLARQETCKTVKGCSVVKLKLFPNCDISFDATEHATSYCQEKVAKFRSSYKEKALSLSCC